MPMTKRTWLFKANKGNVLGVCQENEVPQHLVLVLTAQNPFAIISYVVVHILISLVLLDKAPRGSKILIFKDFDPPRCPLRNTHRDYLAVLDSS